jgi:molecular chaperone GrpE
MTDWPNTEQVLGQLRQWLEEVRAEAEAAGETSETANRPEAVGLAELVRQFTALRHEVKLQTRSARNLEEQTAAAVKALGEAAAQWRSIEPKEAEAAQRAAAPLVETLADLDEALQRGQAVMEAARRRIAEQSFEPFQRRLKEIHAGQPAWKRWLGAGWFEQVRDLAQQTADEQRKVLDSLVEGYDLVRGRLQRAMRREGLEQIASLGRPVDPHTMTVVEAVEDPAQLPGTVVEEVRPGYRWQGRVLRFAEVRAVRRRVEDAAAASPSGDHESTNPS